MAKNRVVLNFSATPGGPFASLAGWSETLWNNADKSPSSLLADLVGVPPAGPVNPYLADRRALLSPGWCIDTLRIYPITGGRVVAQASFPAGAMKGLDVPGALDQEQQPYDRVLWKMNATDGHSRSCRLGGILSDVVDPGGNYIGGQPPFGPGDFGWGNSFYNVFIPHLVTNNFGLRFATISAPFQIVGVEVDNTVIAGASPRTPVVSVAGDQSASFSVGKVVRITGSLSPANLNGQWTIGNAALFGGNTRIFLKAKRNLAITGAFTLGSYIKSLVFEVSPITSGFAVRGVSRRVGRPFGLPRGRRSRRTP